jgi:hypothetical protein
MKGTVETLRRRAFLEERFSYTCDILSLYAIKYNSYLTKAAKIWELLLRDHFLKNVPFA